MPQVSVAIISYQQRAFIGEALRSVVEQDYPNLQVVVSDDHSSDGTAEEIAKFVGRHPGRVVALLNDERVGMTRNSNRALRQCTGKYLCLLGGDDLFLPGKVSRQVAWFEEREARVLCGHEVEVFYEDGSPSHRFRQPLLSGAGPRDIIRHGTFAACSVMVRADRIPSHGFEESLSLVSDFFLWVEVLSSGGEFGYVPGTYAGYRRHSANLSGDGAAMSKDAERALGLIEHRYPQYADECRRARGRLVHYVLAKDHLAHGRRSAARRAFIEAIQTNPGSIGLWLAYIKTLVTA